MKKYGVIDLGTNTFHLLIVAATSEGNFQEIYRKQYFVKLAEEGIDTIGAAPFARALEVMHWFKQTLDEQQVSDLRAFGTAALRTASNGAAFIEQVRAETGIDVQLISGDREAALIHKGVLQAVPFAAERWLIMDIGGGSVEFIIADKDQVYWAQSFPIGVAVLFKNFHHSDPIAPEEIAATRRFLQAQLQPLQAALQRYPTHTLVGASGTFDVLENILVSNKTHPHHSFLDARAFPAFYDAVVHLTLQERLEMEGMPAIRADMIVVALILVDVVMQLAAIEQIVISAFAMKEGMLYEMMHAH
ncbi:MAG: phosphatase [Saprospiraceae bacterium]